MTDLTHAYPQFHRDRASVFGQVTLLIPDEPFEDLLTKILKRMEGFVKVSNHEDAPAILRRLGVFGSLTLLMDSRTVSLRIGGNVLRIRAFFSSNFFCLMSFTFNHVRYEIDFSNNEAVIYEIPWERRVEMGRFRGLYANRQWA
jgi:hypothetical protein